VPYIFLAMEPEYLCIKAGQSCKPGYDSNTEPERLFMKAGSIFPFDIRPDHIYTS